MLQFKIPDMTCGHCEKTIRAALTGLPGVERLEIDLPTKTLRIEGTADPKTIQKMVSEVGYTAEE